MRLSLPCCGRLRPRRGGPCGRCGTTPRNPLWGNPAAREPLKLEVLDRSQAGEHRRRGVQVTADRPAAVIVLAAGGGTRMKSATPKVLHTIGGRTLVGHALAAASG